MQRELSRRLFPRDGQLRRLGQLDSNQRMQGSKPCALPLGDGPMIKMKALWFPKGFRRVDIGIRTQGLQSHNLAR